MPYNNTSVAYDDEPVYYCRSCHSLKIIQDSTLAGPDWDGSYCACCNSSDVGQCSIEEWLAEEDRRKKKRLEIEWRR